MADPDRSKLLRQYLKMKLTCDSVSWRGAAGTRARALDLLKRTVQAGEAHSALLIGPPGCGKTTLISSVLAELEQSPSFHEDAVVVRLNGLLHHDDKLALQTITTQMQLENAVGDRVFGTVAENLSFLLSCLLSGEQRRCKSMLFVLEEFQLFCHGGTAQSLLYNLFDITHAGRAPLCVVGITSRLDVMELLEKRVKSRFSHRIIFLFPNEDQEGAAKTPCERFVDLFVDLLSLPCQLSSGSVAKFADGRKRLDSDTNVGHIRVESAPNTPKSARKVAKSRTAKSRRSVMLEQADDAVNTLKEDSDSTEGTERFALPLKILERCGLNEQHFETIDREFVKDWNASIKSLSEDPTVVDAIEKFSYYTCNEHTFRNTLFRLVARTPHRLSAENISAAVDDAVCPERRIRHLQSLSILEFSLLIAMRHGMDILDEQPMNFEMVWHRYSKFARGSSAATTRAVARKAFEHLQRLELVGVERRGARDAAAYRLCALAATRADLQRAAAGYRALPTEVAHWLNGSLD